MVAGARWRRRGGPAERLDPVRWRRPGRATLLRSATVALLVAVAGALAWSAPAPCAPTAVRSGPADPAAVRSGPADPAASRFGPAGPAPASTGPGPASAAAGRAGPPAPSPAASEPGAAGPAVPADRVGVPLRLTEPAALALVRPGSRVDVLRVEGSGRTTRVASAALVLGVTDPDDLVAAALLVALTPAEAAGALSRSGRGFAVLLRPG